MNQLEAFYDEKPIDVKGKVEIYQAPLPTAAGLRAHDGVIRTRLVYVRVASDAGPFLVPFGEYDEWSLRDKYNEAIRIMNTLGASEISIETFRTVSTRRGFRALVNFKDYSVGPKVMQQREKNSEFDFKHVGAGSQPRDPRPLRWPDEPGFDAAVNSVLKNGSTVLDLNIKSSNDHSIDGKIGIQLKEFGFQLGGGTQKSGATSLHIHASFPPIKKGFLG